MSADNVINVSESDFEYEVIKYSQNVLVLVDFWASWCRPCKELSPLLEHLAKEAAGAFRLARVDADANPNLAVLYNVRTLPTVKAFTNGQVVAEFAGAQPEERLREFISRIAPPGRATLALEKGASLLYLSQWVGAETIYREILEQYPDMPVALLGITKALLAQNKVGEALLILRTFPPSKLYNQAMLLLPLAEALRQTADGELPAETDLDAAFQSAIRLAGRGNLPAALDGLLDILRQDKNYRSGRARQVFLAVLELPGEESDFTRQYRAELATVLF